MIFLVNFSSMNKVRGKKIKYGVIRFMNESFERHKKFLYLINNLKDKKKSYHFILSILVKLYEFAQYQNNS